MADLSADEKDLLERIRKKPELRPLFFRRVKGLRWFDALVQRGFFDPKNIPAPAPAREEGYVTIPRWEALEYLVRTVPEIATEGNIEYSPRFLAIITDATNYAKEQGFGNYHVWWQFSKLLSQIPSKILMPGDLEVVSYWLEDKHDRGLVAEVVGERWLVSLLNEGEQHSLLLSRRLIEILYNVDFVERELAGRRSLEARLRFDFHYADEITKRIGRLAGLHLGEQAVQLFHCKLVEVLDKLDNDTWSSIWQPAIEEHEQNKHHDDAENVLLAGFRDSLEGYIQVQPDQARGYVASLLEGPHQTVQRLAIYCIGKKLGPFTELFDRLIDEKYLKANYRHEMWHFLNRNYVNFTSEQKRRTVALIKAKVRTDEEDNVLEGASAFERSIWLSAIKEAGKDEYEHYQEAVRVAKAEPEHPDFSSYMSVGWGQQRSPYTSDALGSLSIDDLVRTLASYQGSARWGEPGIEGLSRAVKQAIKTAPLNYYNQLRHFVGLDLAYVYSILEAYSELWNENASLPWDDIWQFLFSYIDAIVLQERFWGSDSAKQRNEFVANRHWVIGSIARLLEAGAKSDDRAFHERFHSQAESILKLLLQKESGESFSEDGDAVSIAINSPRGRCIEALINLTLRVCRLEDRRTGEHTAAWAHFQPCYDAELRLGEKGEYEFATLVANYLPNFLYMSKEWVLENLALIFDKKNYQRWLCAMQGYSYVNTVYEEIYAYLSANGHLMRALDDQHLKERVRDRVVQQIVIAFINDYENVGQENSLIKALIKRGNYEELNHLIWIVWTLRKDDDRALTYKVYELWPALLNAIDLNTNDGRKLASGLCLWASYVDRIDADIKRWLLPISLYSDEAHNSHELMRTLARISQNQPFEANEIWREILKRSAPDYPPEAIQMILRNLVSQGEEGKRSARDTVSEYAKQGNDSPYAWLEEILGAHAN